MIEAADTTTGTPTTVPPALEIRDLSVELDRRGDAVPVIDGVSLSVDAGETVALVGESGCGKSVTALSILGLLDPPLRITGGSRRVEGVELSGRSERELRAVRGRRAAMVFQEPMTALNPVMTIGDQVAEGPRIHLGLDRTTAWERAVKGLAEVGIPDPEIRAREYPHQLSGGMRQRALIAMALSCDPALLIADEPTTALDVTIQAQILELLQRLQDERGMGILFITHDLGVVAECADRVFVMYAGRVIEQGSVARLFEGPSHPYTQGLFGALPDLTGSRRRLTAIEGVVPGPEDFPDGCRFHPRCEEEHAPCGTFLPDWVPLHTDHRVACFARDRRKVRR